MSFLGNFANLTGYHLGSFEVESLVGRDGAGYPKWKLICGRCGQAQVVPHSRLAPKLESKATSNLQCANPGCELSRSHRESETLADIRRQERREAEQAEQRRAEEQAQAAEQARKDARIAAIKAEWNEYFRHQLGTKIADAEIIPFERWRKFTPETRRMILDALRKDETAYFTGL